MYNLAVKIVELERESTVIGHILCDPLLDSSSCRGERAEVFTHRLQLVGKILVLPATGGAMSCVTPRHRVYVPNPKTMGPPGSEALAKTP